MGDLKAKRVTVMGLGRFEGGVGVTRWLAAQGAQVLVTDKAPAERLADSLAALHGLPIAFRLGTHDEADFRDADLIVASPAVPESSPYLAAAREAGVPITTEMNLFVERCPARCVGITGSVGKSTITAMTAHVLSNDACEPAPFRRVWLGGNIGRSLLADLPEIHADDVVVLELSSFQLQRTPLVRWSPHIAVITNVTPNHLDWHGSFAAYLAAKLNIVRFQDPQRDAIVIEDAPELKRNFDLLFGDLAGMWRYGVDGAACVAVSQSSSAIDCDDRRLRWEDPPLRVPGRHNRVNAAAALTVAHLLGVPAATATAALASFRALPHRLQEVAERDGVRYFDDSKCTTPEAALTALAAFDEPVLIILGGYDKGSDFGALAKRVAERAKLAACIGVTGPRIAESVNAAGGRAEVCADLIAAVGACRAAAAPRDVVLLSPACASWDQFADYRERGRRFAELVSQDD